MEMTINRALGELKLLDSRINDKIRNTAFVGVAKKNADAMTGLKTKKEDFIKDASSGLQSINDLIERRKQIKSAIVASNATTDIVINGKTLKVADAIERKNSISYEQTLVNVLKSSYTSGLGSVNRANEQVEAKLDELLMTSLGKEAKGKASESDIEVIAKPYKAQNEVELVMPEGLEKTIQEMELDIMTFLAEVDYTLSDSNSITKITIAD